MPADRFLDLLKITDHMDKFGAENISRPFVYTNIVERIVHESRIPSASVGCPTHYVATPAEVPHFFVF